MRQGQTIFMLMPNGAILDYGDASSLDMFVAAHRSADWEGANHWFIADLILGEV